MLEAITSWFPWRRKPEPRVERRKLPRRRENVPVEIQSGLSLTWATAVDMHEQGIMVLSKRSWAPGTTVFLHLKRFRLMGFAEVRHCTRRGRKYAVGMMFRAPLMSQEIGAWRFERICLRSWLKNEHSAAPTAHFFPRV